MKIVDIAKKHALSIVTKTKITFSPNKQRNATVKKGIMQFVEYYGKKT